MRDLRQAHTVLGLAQKDFRALKGMMDPAVFDEEIFGFHAQQTIEESLKAWLAFLGKEYPFSHDISALLELLRGSGQDVEQYWDLVEYNVYAVRFRYQSLEICDEPLDRAAAVQSVRKLISNVQAMLDETMEG
ncbi:MAG: HEPN domain-containing protein [Deltaproteobacteria bacterium]|nr:HEPN domain-containing protein [Deltaproteobacteria bacterium]